jgi:hypothetical protein
MTSLKQIEANRRNAFKSTGPRSEQGKQRASRNAFRHGLTAETVLDPLEDAEDYKLFEEAIAAEYDAETVIERELVLRLAGLFWRLRRASLIETALFELAADTPSEQKQPAKTQSKPMGRRAAFPLLVGLSEQAPPIGSDRLEMAGPGDAGRENGCAALALGRVAQLEVARRFLRLAKLDNGAFDRLNRYELALWRQARQTLFTLEALRWRTRRALPLTNSHFWRRKANPAAE